MNFSEKKTARAQLKRQLGRKVRVAARARGCDIRLKEVRRAVKAIREGDKPENWEYEPWFPNT